MEDCVLKLFRFLNRVVICFTILVLSVLLPGCFVEEADRAYSSFFSQCSNGISYTTLWQMMGAAFVTMGFQWLICESKLLSRVLDVYKTIIVIVGEFVIAVAFVLLFDWFPVRMLTAWGIFIVLFFLCTVISSIVMVSKTSRESKLYEERLAEYKKRREGNKE